MVTGVTLFTLAKLSCFPPLWSVHGEDRLPVNLGGGNFSLSEKFWDGSYRIMRTRRNLRDSEVTGSGSRMVTFFV